MADDLAAVDELLTEIQIPEHQSGSGSAYERLAYRSAVDYPVASIGAWVRVAEGKIESARLVVGAVSSAPLVVAMASDTLTGKPTSATAALKRAADAAKDAAAALGCADGAISVKASRSGGLGPLGRSEGIAAWCVVLLEAAG